LDYITGALTAPEYDSVPSSFDPNIGADIDNAYGLGEHADVDEMSRRVAERAALVDL
jgi:hypothetical protein